MWDLKAIWGESYGLATAEKSVKMIIQCIHEHQRFNIFQILEAYSSTWRHLPETLAVRTDLGCLCGWYSQPFSHTFGAKNAV